MYTASSRFASGISVAPIHHLEVGQQGSTSPGPISSGPKTTRWHIEDLDGFGTKRTRHTTLSPAMTSRLLEKPSLYRPSGFHKNLSNRGKL